MPAKTPAGIDQVAEMWGVDAQQLEAEARRSPEMQVKIGRTYLYDYLLPKFDGDMKKALQAYNGGETRIAKGIVPQESRQYADKVLALTERLKELEAQRRAAGR
jgi:soluble lytic murein transglycosylase-like protein